MRVFVNGQFLSCEEENRTFSVLVEKEGRIIHTGNTLPPQYAAWAQTDLGGACAVPCFGDTHAHMTSANLLLDTRGPDTVDGVIEHIRTVCAGLDRPFIRGFGLSANAVKEKRLPTATELDTAEARPLFIVKYDGHAAVLNHAAMALLPPEILALPGMDTASGLCGGEAFQAATAFFSRSSAGPSGSLAAGLEKTIGRYLAKGFNLVVPVEGMNNNNAAVELVQSFDGKTPLRLRTFFQTTDVDKALACGYTRVGGCFATALDGCFGAEDAALRKPYCTNPANKGWLVYDQQTVTDFAVKANRAGLQIALHGIGDAAIEQIILAYEAALADCPRDDHRHIIIHADLFPQEYLERAGRLGLYCAVQSEFLDWAEEPLDYLKAIIGARALEKHPFTKMRAAGLVLANGSDNPCTVPDALNAIHCACNHPNPAYSVDVLTALKMSTLYPAMLAREEAAMGSLAPGKTADFVLLDRPILETPRAHIRDIGITAIYHGGVPYNA